MSKKIFDLPQEGEKFLTIKIKNNYLISSKIVPKLDLQDLILKYLIINKRGKTIKMIADETDLYSIEDGIKWLGNIFNLKSKNWFVLFDFIPKKISSKKKYKSAIISILMASLSEVSQGKILVNQKSHYEKIMIREKT